MQEQLPPGWATALERALALGGLLPRRMAGRRRSWSPSSEAFALVLALALRQVPALRLPVPEVWRRPPVRGAMPWAVRSP